MKRRIFFWLEKLKITPAERKAVSILMVLLIVLAGLNLGLSRSAPFGDEQYRALEKQFKKRAALLKAKKERLMRRYNPGGASPVAVVRADTVPSDSAMGKSPEQEQNPRNQRINVNTADRQTLESLPGIGPTYARRIIDYRKKNGGFKRIEELKNIRGIAQKRLDKLKPFIKLKDPG